MEYLRALVKAELLDQGAVDIAQSHRDPPNLGVGLKHVERPGGGHAGGAAGKGAAGHGG